MSPSLPPTKRTRIGKREMSPTNSAGDSVTSTPEPEEGKRKEKNKTQDVDDYTYFRQVFKKKRNKKIRSYSGTTIRTSFRRKQ
jgi:hypothetical protein